VLLLFSLGYQNFSIGIAAMRLIKTHVGLERTMSSFQCNFMY